MIQTTPRALSSRRRTGVMALLLAVVINVLLPLAYVAPAQAAPNTGLKTAAEVGGVEAELLSDNPQVCTAQGIQPLQKPTGPTAPGLSGHCVFCFSGVAVALLPAVELSVSSPRALPKARFAIHPDQAVRSATATIAGNPRAPPLSI